MKRLIARIWFWIGVAGLVYPAWSVGAAPAIHSVQITDVTPLGFSVVWQTSEAAEPGIEIFADAGATVEITSVFEVTPFPLYGGDAAALSDYEQQGYRSDLQALSRSQGVMRLRAHGGVPDTTYFVRVRAANTSGNTTYWPPDDVMPVRTALENAFVIDSVQMIVTLSNNDETLDANGWLITAATGESPYPVSTVVGDGAAINQAVVNLSRLFDFEGRNWLPEGFELLEVKIYGPSQGPVSKYMIAGFSSEFSAASIQPVALNIDIGDHVDPGDINGDAQIDLADGIIALQITAGLHPMALVYLEADVNADQAIGWHEALYILQWMAELRP
jgi:hypothetical protein